jgi:hypothetical protein
MGPFDMRDPVCAAKGIHLMPGCTFVARIFGKELATPTENVRAKNARHSMYDLWPTNNIGEDGVIEMAVIIVNPSPRLRVRINGFGAVKKLKAHPLP